MENRTVTIAVDEEKSDKGTDNPNNNTNGIDTKNDDTDTKNDLTDTKTDPRDNKTDPSDNKTDFTNRNDNCAKKPPELARLKSNADIKRDTSGLNAQYMAAGIVNLGAFAAGVCLSWSSSAIPLLRDKSSPIALSDEEASWVASLLCLGACCGAVPAGLLSEHFGRKKTLLYLALPMLVSWSLIASSPSASGLYVGRFVGGVAVGAFSVAIPPYVADVSEATMRAAVANFYHVQFSAGILFGYIIGMVHHTTLLSVLSAIIPITYFIAFIFLPESPVYLMSQGKSSEAKTALRYFRGIDNDIDDEISTMKENIKNAFKNKSTFKQLFTSKSTVKPLIVSFGLMVFQQLSGIYVVIFYAEKLLRDCHSSMPPSSAAIILGFCLVSSTYFSTMLLNKYPRRALLLASFGFMAPSVACLAIFFHLHAPDPSTYNPSITWIPILALCTYVTSYAIGVGPIPWLIIREIFPANVTRRATAFTAGFHWLLAFAVTKLYQNMVGSIHNGWILWNFGVSSIIGAMFVYFLVPETKNRTLEEIQNEFNGIQRKRRHRHIIEVESVSES